ncbi:MAG: flagellar protein FliT [Rhodanobacter sp.]
MIGTLTQALQLSQHMLAAAQAQAWDTVTALDAERDPLLLGAYAPDASTRDQLAQILACNCELEAEVARARDAVALLWQRENNRVQAITAYTQT